MPSAPEKDPVPSPHHCSSGALNSDPNTGLLPRVVSSGDLALEQPEFGPSLFPHPWVLLDKPHPLSGPLPPPEKQDLKEHLLQGW
jgi:hypothetical protein